MHTKKLTVTILNICFLNVMQLNIFLLLGANGILLSKCNHAAKEPNLLPGVLCSSQHLLCHSASPASPALPECGYSDCVKQAESS